MQPWKTDEWFTSPWNYQSGAIRSPTFAKNIKIHDVTLRDGEQQAGIVFSKDEKVRIAEKLAEVGIHRIEAGMPAVSLSDQMAIQEISKRQLGPEIYAFARCMKADIDLAANCGCTGVVTEIPCSEHLIEKAYRWPVDRAIEQSIEVTRYAHDKGLRVVFFTIDSSRATPDWLISTIKTIAQYGHMDAVTIADTMGVLNPHGAYSMVRAIKKAVTVPVEVHFHDDFGLATANTIFALAAGADVIHTSVTGIGERAGNAPYEDIAMALKCTYDVDLGLNLVKLRETSKLVQQIAGIQVRTNRPIVGDTVFDVESGVVTAWWKNCFPKDATELGPFVPSMVGQKPIEIHMGKKSGIPNVEIWLENLGLQTPSNEVLKKILNDVKKKSIEKGGELSIEEFKAIIADYTLENR